MPGKKLSTIYIARHGETQWNVQKKIQGHTDSPLTKNGIIQAKNLATELKEISFSAVYSSDLLRAKRTAEFVALERELIVETTEALRERNFGKYEGSQKRVLELLEELASKNISYETEGIETDEKITERVITFLREISVAYPGKTVLVITHGGILIRLLRHLGYFTTEQLKEYKIGNTAWIKLESDGVDFFIKETKRIERREEKINNF